MSGGVISPHFGGPYLVKQLIVDAYKIARVVGRGETLSLVLCQEAFGPLNDLIERAMLKKTFSAYQDEIQVPLVGSQTSYRIGPSTVSPQPDVEAARPTEVLSAYARRNQHDMPVFVTHAKEDYDRLSAKALQGLSWSMMVYYQASHPAGKIFVWPSPADGQVTLFLTVLYALGTFNNLEEEVSLHPGYRMYFKYALAQLLAAQTGLDFGADNREVLNEAKEALERNNIKPMPVTSTGLAGLGRAAGGGGYDVMTDSGPVF